MAKMGFHIRVRLAPSTSAAPTRHGPAPGVTHSRQGRDAGAFGKSRGPVASSTWARHHIHPHQLQNQEPVAEALCRATCKCPGRQKSTPLRSGALLSLVRMSLKTWWVQRGSSRMAVGSIHPCRSPWTNGGPCTHEPWRCPLFTLTNKLHFLSQINNQMNTSRACCPVWYFLKVSFVSFSFVLLPGENSVNKLIKIIIIK